MIGGQKQKFFVVLGLIVVLASAWYLWSLSAKPVSRPALAGKENTTSQVAVGNRKLSELPPGNSAASQTSRPPKPYETPLYRQFLDSKDFYALYRALDGRTDGEALFYRASLLERCKGWDATYAGPSKAERAQKYMNSMTGAFRDLRREIYAERSKGHVTQDSCRSFPGPISTQQIDDAYRAAAEAGDPRGKLVQLHQALVNRAGGGEQVTAVGVPFSGTTSMNMLTPDQLSEAEASQLKAALASQDPAQILVAGPLLTATYKNYELKFGDGEGLRGIHDSFLWKSVACHYAGGCGVDSVPVVEDCIINARCDVTSYDDKLQKYVVSATDWARFQAYRDTLIKAIDTQDWSLLKESRGPRSNTSGSSISPQMNSPRFMLRVR
jgi:hypothetical protein